MKKWIRFINKEEIDLSFISNIQNFGLVHNFGSISKKGGSQSFSYNRVSFQAAVNYLAIPIQVALRYNWNKYVCPEWYYIALV